VYAQSFQKVPALHALAPTQTAGPFKLAQRACLLIFLMPTIAAAIKFCPEAVAPA
jgi:hypothetical protein